MSSPNAEDMSPTILLTCRKCPKIVRAKREPTDYPEAVRLETLCDDCDRGDGAELVYFDAQGNHITRDPDEVRHG